MQHWLHRVQTYGRQLIKVNFAINNAMRVFMKCSSCPDGHSIHRIKFTRQPHSQALSPLPPFVIGRKTLFAAGHVTISKSGWHLPIKNTTFERLSFTKKFGSRMEHETLPRLALIKRHVPNQSEISGSVSWIFGNLFFFFVRYFRC